MVHHVKQPAVAGTFYPGEGHACADIVARCLAEATPSTITPKALIAPHAGFRFSGPIAGNAYAGLRQRRDQIRRVVLLGPAHRVALKGMAVATADRWATPLGEVPIDWPALTRILRLPDVALADAPFAQEHSLEVHLPFLQQALEQFTLVPVLVGQATPESVARVLREVWGGPETLVVISSDLSHYHDYETARSKDLAAAQAIEMLRSDLLKDDQACGRRPIYGLLEEARRRDLRATAIDVRNSGDTFGNKDRVVGYGAFTFEYASSARTKDAVRARLGRLARAVIRYGIEHKGTPQIQLGGNVDRQMLAMRATFVTITIAGNLRGCIGSTSAHRPLFLDVCENAYKAAFGDPRFEPLTAEEAQHIDVHVSVLSTARRIPVSSDRGLLSELRPDMDGLILQDGNRRALFLPSVWQDIPDPALFVKRLKQKAGLAPGHWSDTMQAFRFTTESFAADDQTETAPA